MCEIKRLKKECEACDGTGISGIFNKKNNIGIVCTNCNGNGYNVIEYKEFSGKRKKARGVKYVCDYVYGTLINDIKNKPGHGVIPYDDWLEGKPFPAPEEFACPACYLQFEDYDKKCSFMEKFGCVGRGMKRSEPFLSCNQYLHKEECWKYAKEHGYIEE